MLGLYLRRENTSEFGYPSWRLRRFVSGHLSTFSCNQKLKMNPSDKIDEQRQSLPVDLMEGMASLTLDTHQLTRQYFDTWRIRLVYGKVRNGKKFCGLEQYLPGVDIKHSNVIEECSRKNVRSLACDLRPLDEFEKDLLNQLLSLPFMCQHATNGFYQMAQDGHMDSYDEYRRTHPDFVSQFSTTGNMHALGNSDFVFFRMYVDGANGGQTRFGDATIITNADVLSEHGWISLHDQLNPFPRRIHRRYYYQSRLLRTSCATGAGSDKRLWSGIQHTYRTGPVKTWLGRKDETKFNSDQAKLANTLEHNFLSEIFYGSQCRLGIALSLLRELRNMRSTGYLNQLFQDRNRDEVDNREVLGSLIRNLFKIEAKLPVRVNIHKGCSRSIQAQLADDESRDHGYLDVSHQTYTCQPLGSHKRWNLDVLNPDGDGRFTAALVRNDEQAKLAQQRSQIPPLKYHLSTLRRQRGKLRKSLQNKPIGAQATTKESIKALSTRIEEADEELQEIKLSLKDDATECSQLLDTLAQRCNVELIWLQQSTRIYSSITAKYRALVQLTECPTTLLPNKGELMLYAELPFEMLLLLTESQDENVLWDMLSRKMLSVRDLINYLVTPMELREARSLSIEALLDVGIESFSHALKLYRDDISH